MRILVNVWMCEIVSVTLCAREYVQAQCVNVQAPADMCEHVYLLVVCYLAFVCVYGLILWSPLSTSCFMFFAVASSVGFFALRAAVLAICSRGYDPFYPARLPMLQVGAGSWQPSAEASAVDSELLFDSVCWDPLSKMSQDPLRDNHVIKNQSKTCCWQYFAGLVFVKHCKSRTCHEEPRHETSVELGIGFLEDLVTQLLAPDPSTRGSAEVLKGAATECGHPWFGMQKVRPSLVHGW